MTTTSTGRESDRRAIRHERKKAAIVAAAWELARTEGVGGLSLRELAARVDLRQPSLYSYFGSKNDLFDAMFAEGNRQLLERLRGLSLNNDAIQAIKTISKALLTFFTEDPTRYQLMNQRTIPGFVPSKEAYAVAEKVFAWLLERLRAAGVTRRDHVDLYVALMAGLAEAQLANEPRGRRWVRHADVAVDMLVGEIRRQGGESDD